MYNFSIATMKSKIAVVVVLLLVIGALVLLLVDSNLLRNKKDSPISLKPKSTSLNPRQETGDILSYKSSDYGIEFNYLSNYEISEAPGAEVYGSTEAVVYTFVNTVKSFVAPVKISVYSFPQQDTTESLIERIKADFPSVKSYPCKKSTEVNKCTYLMAEENKQLPFHFITESSSGLDASFVDMPADDYHIGADYAFFPEPAKTFFETAKRI